MRYWVFTSKPSHFRMRDALVPGDTLDWPTFSRFKFERGDLVFIYASSPVSQMVGKLEIEETALPFSEADPRNDLRKWPKTYSRVPWLRLRVLQSAPVPFKPLQRGSLYYHTEFKPSPYPKLLHEGEVEYVLRAFDDAMAYDAHMTRHEGGLNPAAMERVTGTDLLRAAIDRLPGAAVERMEYSRGGDILAVVLSLPRGGVLTLTFRGVKRVVWQGGDPADLVTGMRLDLENTYLLARIDGAGLEVLAEAMTAGGEAMAGEGER